MSRLPGALVDRLPNVKNIRFGGPSSISISNTYLLVFPRVLVYLGGRVGVVKSPVSKAHEWGEWVLVGYSMVCFSHKK